MRINDRGIRVKTHSTGMPPTRRSWLMRFVGKHRKEDFNVLFLRSAVGRSFFESSSARVLHTPFITTTEKKEAPKMVGTLFYLDACKHLKGASFLFAHYTLWYLLIAVQKVRKRKKSFASDDFRADNSFLLSFFVAILMRNHQSWCGREPGHAFQTLLCAQGNYCSNSYSMCSRRVSH